MKINGLGVGDRVSGVLSRCMTGGNHPPWLPLPIAPDCPAPRVTNTHDRVAASVHLPVLVALGGRVFAGGVVAPVPRVGGLVRVLGWVFVAARDGMPGIYCLSIGFMDVSPAVAFCGLNVRVRIKCVQMDAVICHVSVCRIVCVSE